MDKFEDLIGKTIVDINLGYDELKFVCDDGTSYLMNHEQDCCESVSIEDVVGDISDLLNSPVLKASEDTSRDNPVDIVKESQDSYTWTFYNIATAKGHVTIRWYGESNGYYSESVTFKKIST